MKNFLKYTYLLLCSAINSGKNGNIFDDIPCSKKLINVIYYDNGDKLSEEKSKIQEDFLQIYLSLNQDANVIVWADRDSQLKLKVEDVDLGRLFIFDKKELKNQIEDQLKEKLEFDYDISSENKCTPTKFDDMNSRFKDIAYKLGIAKTLFEICKYELIVFVSSEVFPWKIKNNIVIDTYGFDISIDDLHGPYDNSKENPNELLILDNKKGLGLIDFMFRIFRNENLLNFIDKENQRSSTNISDRIYNINCIMYLHWFLNNNKLSSNDPNYKLNEGTIIDERIIEFMGCIKVHCYSDMSESEDLIKLINDLITDMGRKKNDDEDFNPRSFGYNFGIRHSPDECELPILPFIENTKNKNLNINYWLSYIMKECNFTIITANQIRCRTEILMEYRHELGKLFIGYKLNLSEIMNNKGKLIELGASEEVMDKENELMDSINLMIEEQVK